MGANACGNVGNVLSKQYKHLQRSTSKALPLAHFCRLHWSFIHLSVLCNRFAGTSETSYEEILFFKNVIHHCNISNIVTLMLVSHKIL